MLPGVWTRVEYGFTLDKLGTLTSMETNLVGPVADALDELTERDRQILAMTYVEGLNSTEIASRLKMQPSAVRQQRKRLLARLAGNEDLKAVHSSPEDDLESVLDEAREYPFMDKQGWLIRGELPA